MIRTTIFLLFSLFVAAISNAQTIDQSVLDAVETRRVELTAIEAELLSAEDVSLLEVREKLRGLRADALLAARPLREMREELQQDIDRLGPEPGDGGAEAQSIAELRDQLTRDFRAVDTVIRQSDLNITQIARLLNEISQKRRENFYSEIFQRHSSPVQPAVWSAALQSFEEGREKFVAEGQKYFRSRAENESGSIWPPIGAALFAAVLLFWPVRRWMDAEIIKRMVDRGPTWSNRLAVAGVRTLARIIPGLIGGYIVYEVCKWLGLVSEGTQQFALSIWFGLIALFVVDGVVTAIFAPKNRDWRLIPIRSRGATSVRIFFWGATLLFAGDAILNSGAAMLGASSELTELQASLVAILGGILLAFLCRKPIWKLQEDNADFQKNTAATWTLVRQAGYATGFFVIIASLMGYGALGRFVVTRIFFLLAVLGLGWFARGCVQELIAYFRDRSVQRAIVSKEIAEGEQHLVYFWIGIVADILLFLAVLPFTLVVLGMGLHEVGDWMQDAYSGFSVGPLRISLAQIASAIFALVLVLIGTRLLQRGLDQRVFVPAKIDDGVRNSFRTLLGYTGLIIGVFSALGVMGLKFANLAIVAGALSIGIGFGLQSIVNNFVSGLILLFERPIKAGDWVVVASGEGIVKRISVRSTEIETFDRASIIVPNSELIASSVTNWTHKDKYTRIIIQIGVAYKEDPQQIFDILNEVMRKNARVVYHPEPMVFFAGFGASSLDFEMRVFIRTTTDRIPVQNELRMAAFNAFRKAGIEIPFPQQDVYIRSISNGEENKENDPGVAQVSDETEI